MSPSAALRAVAALVLAAAPISAQTQLALDVGGGAPSLQVGAVLDDEALEDAVRSGLPLRMSFRVDLWRDELFDDLVGEAAWSAVVAYEPLAGHFLAGLAAEDSLGVYGTWSEVRQALERTYRLPSTGRRPSGRYYYIGALEIETLSLSDLDELENWLRGELEPAVRGDRSVGGAVGTGVKRLLIRILGLPARRFEVRSSAFTIP